MKTSIIRACLFATTGAVLFSGGGFIAAAQAQDSRAAASAEDAETLVVTARRRSESVLEAPISVTAISGDLLRNSGISELRDVLALVPNAVIQDSSESLNTHVNIRGMLMVDIQAEPNVGMYRNGMYVGGHRANLGSLVDIDRVEVLRGPQGGFYGRSSVGGTVDIIYATPKRELGGYARVSYGSYNRTEVEGAVNLPIGEKSALRLTGWSYNQTRSEMYNETLSEYIGASSDVGIRGGYLLDVTDRLNVLWTLEYTKAEGPSLRAYAPNGVLNGGIRSLPETPQLVRKDTRSDSDKTQFYFAQSINYDADFGRLTLNANYRDYDFSSVQDLDHTNIGPEAGPAAQQISMFRDEGTQDFFVEGLWASPTDRAFTWLLGASYFNETFDFARVLNYRRNSTPAIGIHTAPVGFPKHGTSVKTDTLSAFATLNYAISPQFSVEGSLRYSRDTKRLNFLQGILPSDPSVPAFDAWFAAAFGGAFPTYDLKSRSRFVNWSPSLTARYRVTDDVMVYALYGTGFRPGAFNLSPTTPDTIPYGQETAKNYELGMKGRFLDGRLDLSLAGFYMRQEDMLITLQASLAGVMRNYLANAGSANTYGIEAEAHFRPTNWLVSSLAVGYLNPKFDDARTASTDLSGKLIPNTRRWTVNARLDADKPVSESVNLIGSAALRYESGGVLGDYYINHPYETMTKIDLNAGFTYKENTRVTAYVRNLLDQNINLFWYYNGATNASQGRTIGFDISHRF